MFTDNEYPSYLKLELYEEAIERALETHGTSAIHPCGSRTDFDDCFTSMDGSLIFWYDVQIPNGRTTCITTKQIPN